MRIRWYLTLAVLFAVLAGLLPGIFAGGSWPFAAVVLAAIAFGLLALALVAWPAVRELRAIADDVRHLAGNPGLDLPASGNGWFTEVRELRNELRRSATAIREQWTSLRDQADFHATMLGAAVDALVVWDQDGIIVDCNPASEKLFGFAQDQMAGLPYDALVGESSRADYRRKLAKLGTDGWAPGQDVQFHGVGRRFDGTEFPVEIEVSGFERAGSRFVIGVHRDVSERKTLEARQAETTRELRQALADLAGRQFAFDQHAIVSIADVDGNIIYVNDKFCEISGFDRSELIGANHRVVKSGEHPRGFFRELWRTIISGKVWRGEVANRSKGGDLYWLATTIVPMLDEQGLPRQYISISTDITPEKLAERKLIASEGSLRELVDQYRVAEEALTISRERELLIGRQIQESLLSMGEAPYVPRLSIAVFNRPSQGVDGDFVEFVPFGLDGLDLLVGDVMGKGVPAALLGAAVLQQAERALNEATVLALSTGDKPGVADFVNSLHAKLVGQLSSLETFVTLVALRIDTEGQVLRLVDAGHSHVLILRDGQAQPFQGENMPLGVDAHEVYREVSTDFLPGDVLCVYSDGIIDARNLNGDLFGEERLHESLTGSASAGLPAPVMLQLLQVGLAAHEGGAPAADDRTCVMVEFEPEGCATLELPWDLDELAPLRGEVQEAGTAIGLDDEQIGAAVLATYEVATNIVRHNPMPLEGATISCTLNAGADGLEILFHYLGKPFEPRGTEPDFSGATEHGFGLYVIRQSVDEFECISPVPGVVRIRLFKQAKASLFA